MKNVSLVIVFVLGMMTALHSQSTEITGTWKAQLPDGQPTTLEFKSADTTLTGVIKQGQTTVNIYDGKIDGNAISFKVKTNDGTRTITFTGTITGAEISFTRDVRVEPGGTRGGRGIFGAGGPGKFTAIPTSSQRPFVDAGTEYAAAVNLPERNVKIAGTLFLPSKLGRVRAVIVIPYYGLGSAFYADAQVGELLETTESGLLTIRVSNIQTTRTAPQRGASQEAADALLTLLRRFAQESGHQELADAPLLFWGHSRAGNWGPGFAALYPERTIACVLYHSAGGGAAAERGALAQIPTLVFEAGKDETPNALDPVAFFEKGRAASGPWTFAVEPDATHGDTRDLVKANGLLIPWIVAVMLQRVSSDGKTLRPVTDRSGFLGSNQTGEFASYGRFTGPRAEASWLPDEASAQGWRTVIQVEK